MQCSWLRLCFEADRTAGLAAATDDQFVTEAASDIDISAARFHAGELRRPSLDYALETYHAYQRGFSSFPNLYCLLYRSQMLLEKSSGVLIRKKCFTRE